MDFEKAKHYIEEIIEKMPEDTIEDLKSFNSKSRYYLAGVIDVLHDFEHINDKVRGDLYLMYGPIEI